MGHRASLSPEMPADVAAVFGAAPDAPRARLLALRDLIFDTAARHTPDLAFIGNREIALPLDRPLPRAELGHCIAVALTYHPRKSAP
ncbi:MAG: hypothetical protein WEA77_10020 [Hyphomonas sp.]|uniref:hypothetical protein n=1 Tax=Hyphomonas sp. TaxID=87 RepID=UPI00349FE358